MSRPTAIHARPHAAARAIDNRAPYRCARRRLTSAATAITATATQRLPVAPRSPPVAAPAAATFAHVATVAQPRYRPNVTSVTTMSARPVGAVAWSRTSTRPRQTTSSVITSTLTHTHPC
ncbi:hypothetical protein [Microbacterium sp. NIBRBAC000506063]|uniref:hypothetical protein n=1 Tax=Microbacterium sp. NIBRBAC000506063 TaxID=2734618 RepID=UPI001BB51D17|nr:hypothetical protein [Microbacterium sp. NIBRBAC000506063]QTV79785.1 hypothetical protein KAE78_00420 [Microbacterium sp. NIBRBAC000506063]